MRFGISFNHKVPVRWKITMVTNIDLLPQSKGGLQLSPTGMNYQLHCLLPYSNKITLTSLKEKIRVLQVLIFLCKMANNAIQSFIAFKLNDFDAQVSENLCQIRAYQLLLFVGSDFLIYKNNLLRFSKTILPVHAKCECLLQEHKKKLQGYRASHYTKEIDQTLTIEEFMNSHRLNLVLSTDQFFLIQAFILSKYKLVGDYDISYGIDYDSLCQDLDIDSKTYARKVIHHFQRNLSEYSCQFIIKLLNNLNAGKFHNDLLMSLYYTDEVGRHVMSCYEVTKVILLHVLKSGKHVQVTIFRESKEEKDQISFILNPSTFYTTTINSDEQDVKGTLLFIGRVFYKNRIDETKDQYISRFLDVGFENIILSNMAIHPQYAGIKLSEKKDNPYRLLTFGRYKREEGFLKHKYLSNQIGCSKENPSLFLLTHVRCHYDKNYIYQFDTVELLPEESLIDG